MVVFHCYVGLPDNIFCLNSIFGWRLQRWCHCKISAEEKPSDGFLCWVKWICSSQNKKKTQVPGKHVVYPLVLAKWIAVFRGFKLLEINSNFIFQAWPFFTVLHFPGWLKYLKATRLGCKMQGDVARLQLQEKAKTRTLCDQVAIKVVECFDAKQCHTTLPPARLATWIAVYYIHGIW